MTNICPCCGYNKLTEPAYLDDEPSFEICSCCGFQFGVTEDDDNISLEEWRNAWIREGMPWRGSGEPPFSWNPEEQLKSLL